MLKKTLHEKNAELDDFFAGLKTLEASLYPKRCYKCGNVYNSPEEFFTKTRNIKNDAEYSGLKMAYDDDDNVIIEAFRNCTCGSTLLSNFGDRRDQSEQGIKRRAQFEVLMNYLIAQGMDKQSARKKLLTLLKTNDGSINLFSNNDDV